MIKWKQLKDARYWNGYVNDKILSIYLNRYLQYSFALDDFLFLYSLLGFNQAWSNVVAFFFACSFSFVINAYWTFKSSLSWFRYLRWISIMGGVAYITGFFSESLK